MSAQTAISWTDSTFNPWIGCTKVSPACDHCYAERDWDHRRHRVQWGAGNPRSRTAVETWKLPKRWDHEVFWECSCGFRGSEPTSNGAILLGGSPVCPDCHMTDLRRARRRVFSASLGDWLDNEVSIEWLVDFLDLVRRTPNLDWLLLSKRIGNWRKRIGECIHYLDHHTDCTKPSPTRAMLSAWIHASATPPANVWVGSTVVTQAEADRDVPKLLAVPARVRFLSIEPMLGPINLTKIDLGDLYHLDALRGHETILHDGGMPAKRPFGALHWIIAGGESGPHARPMHPDWVRSLRDQCVAAGVAFHFKQWGEWAPPEACGQDVPSALKLRTGEGAHVFPDHSQQMARIGKKAAGRLLDGVEHNGMPQ